MDAYKKKRSRQRDDWIAFHTKTVELAIEKFKKLFGVPPDDVICNEDGPWISLVRDDVAVRAIRSYKIVQFFIDGQCPRCGMPALGKEIKTLEDLGEALLDFQPGSSHTCRKEKYARHSSPEQVRGYKGF